MRQADERKGRVRVESRNLREVLERPGPEPRPFLSGSARQNGRSVSARRWTIALPRFPLVSRTPSAQAVAHLFGEPALDPSRLSELSGVE